MTDAPNIALRAYELWDAAGRPEGRSDEFYFAAEEEFRLLIEQRTAINEGQALVQHEINSGGVDEAQQTVGRVHGGQEASQ